MSGSKNNPISSFSLGFQLLSGRVPQNPASVLWRRLFVWDKALLLVMDQGVERFEF